MSNKCECGHDIADHWRGRECIEWGCSCNCFREKFEEDNARP